MISPMPIKRCARRCFHGLSSAGGTLQRPLHRLLIRRHGNEANPEGLCGLIIQSADLPAVGVGSEFGLVAPYSKWGEGFESRFDFDVKRCDRKLSYGVGPYGKPPGEERRSFLTGTI
jgi:hypothetical protein